MSEPPDSLLEAVGALIDALEPSGVDYARSSVASIGDEQGCRFTLQPTRRSPAPQSEENHGFHGAHGFSEIRVLRGIRGLSAFDLSPPRPQSERRRLR